MMQLPVLLETPITPSSEERRRSVVADVLGERSFESINWKRLMQDGVLVRLHVRRCRFATQLTLEDMGVRVEDDAVRQKLSRWLVLGEKRLLPETYMKALARIESSARYVLKERAFRTELGSFVPSTAYITWKEITQSLKDQYFRLRDEILSRHRELVRQVLAEYEVIASDTYERLRGSHPEYLTETREQFVASYCDRIASQIPTPERIRDTFDFNYILVDGLSQLGVSLPEALPQNRNENLSSDSITTLRPEMDERERQRALLENDLRAHAQERVNTALDSFLSSVVGQLRTLIYDASCDVLATLQRRSDESFAPQSVKQLTHLLTQVRALNFYGDIEIERMMDQITAIVEQTPEERRHSLGDIGQTLRSIATVTRSTLMDLDADPRSARELAIADFPSPSAVRQARAELGLELDLTQFTSQQSERRSGRAEQEQNSLWHITLAEPQRVPRPV